MRGWEFMFPITGKLSAALKTEIPLDPGYLGSITAMLCLGKQKKMFSVCYADGRPQLVGVYNIFCQFQLATNMFENWALQHSLYDGTFCTHQLKEISNSKFRAFCNEGSGK